MADPTTAIDRALSIARERLLAKRTPAGHWEGSLSSSALSTATAVTALALYESHGGSASGKLQPLIQGGLKWLAAQANPDGGWGDTTRSLSNISTTALGWAAFGAVPGAGHEFREVITRAAAWLERAAGGSGREKLARAIIARYGRDRTFSVPILTMCALAGRLGPGRSAWDRVIPLPFELAALPQRFFAALRLPVVSYALPALIAIGQARHVHAPSRNPIARAIRTLARQKTLRVLETIQPENGGFLEATPLTSFVVMSLAASGLVDHPVTRKGIAFLAASVREDGSWPIDTNLATWVTTLSVNVFGSLPREGLSGSARKQLREWLLRQQYRSIHPYTQAPPGGWAWTDLPGGVPDADDTAGALLALKKLGCDDPQAVAAGLEWLLNLQNGDGGIPTFCRGWTNLPFDRSSPDLTAHALRAWGAWLNHVPAALRQRLERAIPRAIRYLLRAQRPEGSWIPLWFGNQHDRDDENHVYGTARVLVALAEWGNFPGVTQAVGRAVATLLSYQLPSGEWRGANAGPGSVEETGLAVEALAVVLRLGVVEGEAPREALRRGAAWLAAAVEDGRWEQASPIGFYFARLWYYERLYPLILTTGALHEAARLLQPNGPKQFNSGESGEPAGMQPPAGGLLPPAAAG